MDEAETMALCRAARHYDMPIDDETESMLTGSFAYQWFLLDERARPLIDAIAAHFRRLAGRIARILR